MRQIVLDTETTGLEPELNHRIIEIGCVELVNRRTTGRTFHRYLNPERDIDDGALAVHGISRAELDGQPRFADVAEELVGFIGGAELVIHNAAFDVAFLDAELARLPGERRQVGAVCQVLDTLALARELDCSVGQGFLLHGPASADRVRLRGTAGSVTSAPWRPLVRLRGSDDRR